MTWLTTLGTSYALSWSDGDGMLVLDRAVYGASATSRIAGHGIIRYLPAGDMNARVWSQEVKPLWDKYSKGAGA